MENNIGVGDLVVATCDGQRAPSGLPKQIPIKGKIYRITSVYEMHYGLGCTLAGMDHSPFKGYYLYTHKGKRWYFKRVEPATEEFKQMIANCRPKAPAKKEKEEA